MLLWHAQDLSCLLIYHRVSKIRHRNGAQRKTWLQFGESISTLTCARSTETCQRITVYIYCVDALPAARNKHFAHCTLTDQTYRHGENDLRHRIMAQPEFISPLYPCAPAVVSRLRWAAAAICGFDRLRNSMTWGSSIATMRTNRRATGGLFCHHIRPSPDVISPSESLCGYPLGSLLAAVHL